MSITKENMFNIEDLIQINVNNININGEGVSNFNNKKVCLKNVLPDEEVLAVVKTQKSNFISAEPQKILKPNPLRITPPCPYYEKCGGCDFQVIDDSNGLNLKKQVISDYLSNFYKGQIKVNKSKNLCHYRNKMSFFVDDNKIGLVEESSNKIVEIDYCLIASKQINNILKVLKNFLTNNKSKLISHIVVRELDNNFVLTVVSRGDLVNSKNISLKLVELLKQNFSNTSFGVYLNLNKSNKQILGDSWHHIYGLKFLTASIIGIKFCVHPYSFLQVNFDVMQQLYSEVLNYIDNNVVIEGYSGAGLLSCIMAKKAKKVISVEINKSATQSANQTKQINNVNNLENINADCKNVLPQLTKTYPNATFVVDPARSGCDKDILESLNNSSIKKIVYISCNPYTLKQNLGLLSQSYEVKEVQLFDMFPKTSHIETLVCLERKG